MRPTSSRSLCLPPARTHFCELTARVNGGTSSPTKYGLNGTIPATVNSTVGSCGIRLADGTGVWPRAAKKSMNDWRSSSAVRGGDVIGRWRAYRAGPRTGAWPAANSVRGVDGPTPPDDLHEWISFEDPSEQRTWVFDATFLRSNYRCIYGAGCPGILDAPAPELEQGCCSYGAHFVDDDDVADVVEAFVRLTPAPDAVPRQGQARRVPAPGEPGDDGVEPTVTRLVDDACIFLNRPGLRRRRRAAPCTSAPSRPASGRSTGSRTSAGRCRSGSSTRPTRTAT